MALILWLLLMVPSLAQAAILVQEGWEGTPSTITHVPDQWWDNSCGGSWPSTSNPGLSTLHPFAGTHSLHGHFQGHQQTHIDAGFTTNILDSHLFGGCAAAIYPAAGALWSAPSQEVWLTYYEYVTGYTPLTTFFVDEVGTKDIVYLYAGNAGNQHALSIVPTYMNGSLGEMTMNFAAAWDVGQPDGPHSYPSDNIYNNHAMTPQNDHWTCWEWRIKLNNPGVSNGVVELYATDITAGGPAVQLINNTGRQFIGTSTGSSIPSDSLINEFKVYVQDGWGDIYQDNHTLSTTRVGCQGTIIDTTAPSPPTVSLTSVTGASVTVGWSGAFDAIGVTGYRLDASTVSNFSTFLPGFQNLNVGNVTTYTVAGLSPSTTHYVRVRAYDAALNTSVNSNTASGTTTTVTVPPIITTFVTDAAGFNETHSGALASYVLRYGDNGGSFVVSVPLSLAQVPSGRYNIAWPAQTNWACLDAYDATATINPDGTLCTGVSPGDVTAPAAPTGLTIAALAALLLLGGFYALMARTTLPQSGLALSGDHADPTTLRTVALPGSADGAYAVYQVPLEHAPDDRADPPLGLPADGRGPTDSSTV